MKKLSILIILTVSLAPFTVAADEEYEVTIRVLGQNEETPETVINTISLPEISIGTPSVAGNLNGEMAEISAAQESGNFGDDAGPDIDSPDIEFDIGDIQGEANSHGGGK